MKAKSAIRDIGKSLGIDPSIINLITKEFNSDNEDDVKKAIESSSAIKSYSEKYPELFKHTLRIIGFPRQIGTHASAVVISLTPLNDVVPLMTNSQDSILSTQYAADYLEKLGLVKVDLLSLSNLTTIQNIISLVKTTRGESVDIFTIPLDDKKVFSTLSAGETSGIFQLSSPGITSLTKRIKPTSIQDISTISALFRPGANTLMNEYIANRQDPSKIKYLNDNFKSILLPTYGVIIYQEQLMEIVKVSANYTMSQADAFRKIISKKNKVELLKLEDDFKKATIANGYSAEQSIEIFKYIERFASYGFNMSHSISYSYVSY
jgi:DNA polymerase-3 subunit alpha